ncbi:hypothetical protein AVEN_756-1 [Araneus ventricosus]|uniref:RNA-directed DNA polymerase from mobile element jockey n=1 Tax=Araneus ventricosus TaxID=182803 RepID=A0A4Y2WTW5_ARAVE|nr:hypothetical protein AVEN_756-1 [Araneus ventricosus]
MDKQLNFRAHISQVKEKYNKAFRAQYSLICRNSSLNLNNKVLIYLAYLRPILTYASPIWAFTARSNLGSIQVLENNTLRMIANARWYHRNIDIRNALNLPSLPHFIQKLAKNFYGKLPDINNPELAKIPVYDHNDKQNPFSSLTVVMEDVEEAAERARLSANNDSAMGDIEPHTRPAVPGRTCEHRIEKVRLESEMSNPV